MADKPKAIPFMINQVEALYPRIDKPYRFDNKENRSVPCDVDDDGAKYEINFNMTSDQAKKLFSQMKAAYLERAGNNWPEKFDNPFKKKEDGLYEHKSILKAAYNGQPTRKPVQYDASNNKLPDDFLLTTGSTVNIAGVFVPYNTKGIGTGVSLRLNAVQVTNYVPYLASSPFESTEGFEVGEENPFQSEEPEVSGEEVIEEIVEPKKVAKKSASVKAKDPEIDAIVDDWDD